MAWPPALPEQAGGEGEGEAAMDTDTDMRTVEIIIWEFKNEGRPNGTVSKSKSKSWKWVEIARMPSVFFIEWRYKLRSYYEMEFLRHCCIGVGDNVCFVPSYPRSSLSDPVEVIVYNLIDNTWSWLPSCPKSRGEIYKPMAFEPNLTSKVE